MTRKQLELLWSALLFALLLALVTMARPLGAQTKPSLDSALAVRTKADCVTVNRYKSTGATARKAATRCQARQDSIIANHRTPTKPPVDSLPPSPVVVGDTASVPELPRVVPAPAFGKATRVVQVAPPMDLQAAITAAQPGDSLILTGTWTGNYLLPTRQCGAGITIAGTASALPVGTRVSPATAAGFAKIVTPNSEAAIRAASPTCGWRLESLEITGTLAQTSVQYGLVVLGGGTDEGQTTMDKVPQNIVLSHVYVHGTPTLNTMRCVAMQSGNTVVRDSYLSECHGQGFDSQAIAGWNGPGPFLIENNYLEGAGENVMFGGADPAIPGLRPSDITIRSNHFHKPREWKGGPWVIKNLFELKNARRVLLVNNVFQDNWPAGQEGFGIVIKSSQGSETNPVSLPQGTTDVHILGNVVDSAAVAIDLHASDCYPTCPTIRTSRITVRGNYARNIGLPGEGRAAGMLITKEVSNIVVDGNTFVHHPSVGTARGSAITFDYGNARALTFTNNYWTGGAYQVFFGGKIGTAALDSMAGPGNWTFTGNAVVYGTPSRYPAGNTFPSSPTVTSTAGADTMAVLAGVAGVVQPLAASRFRAARPSVPVELKLTPADVKRMAKQPEG